MQLTRQKQTELATKLQTSRLRLLERHPFYGILLLNIIFSLDINAGTAYTDGTRIAFDPVFLDELSPSEVDFILQHEILHAALNHVYRGEKFENHEAFNIATDIVVNSNILKSNQGDLASITTQTAGESMHLLPDGREGFDFSAEEIYPLIYRLYTSKSGLDYNRLTSEGRSGKKGKNKDGQRLDNHEKWKDGGEDSELQRQIWLDRMVKATDLIAGMAANGGADAAGDVPAFMERILKELRESKLDWRTMLANFIEEDFVDYSYCPPDRRFQDSDFFLPDFNVKDEEVRNVLFMIDTSGSIDDKMLTDAFSEIKSAVDQFDGRLEGKLGFFDAKVYDPMPFDSVDSLLDIKPVGGGGTDFGAVFRYIDRHMGGDEIASIVILTDGYASFPDESAANGIPVLWLINNDKVTPPWGKTAIIH